MTREEFEKLKAAERAHLEQLRELKQTVRQHKRRQSVVGALERLRDAARDLLDRHEDAVDELTRETAYLEARAEVEHSTADDELQALRAQMLVDELKNVPSEHEESAPSADASPENPSKDPVPPVVEKTIGRVKR